MWAFDRYELFSHSPTVGITASIKLVLFSDELIIVRDVQFPGVSRSSSLKIALLNYVTPLSLFHQCILMCQQQ